VQVSVSPEKRNVLERTILIKINVLTEQKESVSICINVLKLRITTFKNNGSGNK